MLFFVFLRGAGKMKLFLQTINPGEVKDFAAAGLVHGVTASKGHDLTEILAAVPGPVSVGVSAKADFPR